MTDDERLAKIRAQMEMWQTIDPEAVNWDSAFLIRLIDRLKTDNLSKRQRPPSPSPSHTDRKHSL